VGGVTEVEDLISPMFDLFELLGLMAVSGASALPELSSQNWKWRTGGLGDSPCGDSRCILALSEY
jgi:hypothetical protein